MGCEGDILFLQPKTTGRLKRWLMVLSGGGALVNGWFLCRVSRRVLPRAGVPGTRDRDGEGQLFLLDSHCYLMFVAAIVGRFSLFFPPSGLCLRRRRDSLGDGQVHFVTQSKTGGSSQAEETSPGDGKEDGH